MVNGCKWLVSCRENEGFGCAPSFRTLDIPKSGSLRFAPRRDFKGDYCDLEPLVGAKQLLRTIEGVAQVSFFRRERSFATFLSQLLEEMIEMI